jgi:GNAT superfamily N-acetyltransferase
MIRSANLDDVPDIVAIGMETLAGELAYQAIHGDEALMAAHVETFLDDPARIALVADDGGINGFILAMVAQSGISRELSGVKMSWAMKPGGKGAGVRLLRAAESWAKKNGARRFLVSIPSPHASMAREGYAPFETVYQKVL